MFNNPLEAERDAHWSGLDVADKAFEAAFSNENDTSQAGESFLGGGYDNGFLVF